MIVGFIGTHSPDRLERLAVLQALGGVLSPEGEFIFLPGADLPSILRRVRNEWQPVNCRPSWVKTEAGGVTMAKEFSQFRLGLAELMKVSFSAEQALIADAPHDPRKAENPEAAAVAVLATNVVFDRPTGNGVGWDQCEIKIRAGEVEYITSGGLRFGWMVFPGDFQSHREKEENVPPSPAEGTNRWVFYAQHPSGEFYEGSSLLESCREHGWEERTLERIWRPVVHR